MLRKIAKHRQLYSAAASLLACAGVLLATVYLARAMIPLGASFLAISLVVYFIGSAVVLICFCRYLDAIKFGRANFVTLIRWSLTAVLVALAAQESRDAVLWVAVVLASIALLLDGVDGWLARRFSESSEFGARFDMETDAALILVLAALVWQFDRAGAWILTAGFLRYGFMAASSAFDWLARPLPRSRRRQTVCVIQVAALVVCLVPLLPSTVTSMIAAAGLAILAGSFWIDILWAARHRGTAPEHVAV